MGEKGSIFPAIQDLFKPSLQLTAKTKSAQTLTPLWHVRMFVSALVGPAILYVLLSNIEPIPDEDRIPLAMNGFQHETKTTTKTKTNVAPVAFSNDNDNATPTPTPPRSPTIDDYTDATVGALVTGSLQTEFEQLAKKMEQLQQRLDDLGLLSPSRPSMTTTTTTTADPTPQTPAEPTTDSTTTNNNNNNNTTTTNNTNNDDDDDNNNNSSATTTPQDAAKPTGPTDSTDPTTNTSDNTNSTTSTSTPHEQHTAATSSIYTTRRYQALMEL